MRGVLKVGALSAAVLCGVVAGAGAQSLGPPPGGVPDGPSPVPPRAPGSMGLPSPQSPAVTSALRQAALDGYKRTLPSMSHAEAERRIDLQVKTPDFHGRLLGRLGRGVSQTWFDNAAGRFVVVLGPKGDEQRARQALAADFGLKDSEVEIKRADLHHRELGALVKQTSDRLQTLAPGHATVGTAAAPGVQILVAKSATARERALADDVAKTPGVYVTQSDREALSVRATACESHMDTQWTGLPARFCTNLRGGSRFTWWTGSTIHSCTLGWWAGFAGYPSYSDYFLTAGHCLEPGGGTWDSCSVTPGGQTTACRSAGWQCCRQLGADGDNGVLGVSSSPYWYRDAGWTDWRNNGRHPISRTEFYPQVGTWMCHGGATQGFSCGVITNDHAVVDLTDATGNFIARVPDMIESVQAGYPCVRGGDSGGPVFTLDGDGAIGTVSAGFCGQGGRYDLTAEPLRREYNTYGLLPYGG